MQRKQDLLLLHGLTRVWKERAPDSLLDMIGKDAKFLLVKSDNDSVAGDGLFSPKRGKGQGDGWTLNESVIETSLTTRAKYMLSAVHLLMQHPNKSRAGIGGEEYVSFEDLSVVEAQKFAELLQFLVSDNAEAKEYIVDLESRYIFQRTSPDGKVSCEETWGGMWAKVLSMCVTKASKAASKAVSDGKTVPRVDWKSMLPPVKTIIEKSMQDKEKEKGSSTEHQPEVKSEEQLTGADAEPVQVAESAPQLGDADELARDEVTFAMIYEVSNAEGKQVLATDVLAVQAHIEAHVLTNAASGAQLSCLCSFCSQGRILLTSC